MGSGNTKPSQKKLDKLRGEIEDWVETLDNDIDVSEMQVIAIEILAKKMKHGKQYAAEYMAKCNGVARVAGKCLPHYYQVVFVLLMLVC
jgi:hypothetical protein